MYIRVQGLGSVGFGGWGFGFLGVIAYIYIYIYMYMCMHTPTVWALGQRAYHDLPENQVTMPSMS